MNVESCFNAIVD
jgi:hypothetical protein